MLPGGVLRGADGSLAGGPTLAGLEPMRGGCRAARLFGLRPRRRRPDGLDPEKVAVKRAMLAAARRVLGARGLPASMPARR
jgi:hypothetical protein